MEQDKQSTTTTGLLWRVTPWIFLLCRYFHCHLLWQMWHFLGWQCAGLSETSYCSFPTPWALSVQQMSKTHFRPGWEGEGKVAITTGVTSPVTGTHSRSHSAASQPGHFAFRRETPMGTEGWCLEASQRDCFLLHQKWAPLPDPRHQNHRQTTATTRRFSVLWLGAISRRRWHTGFGFQTLVNPSNINFKLDISSYSLHLGFLCISIPPLTHFTSLLWQ